MASGMNKVLLLGRLGTDPEIRYTTNGGVVANFNVATNESWTDKSGQKQERTEWHRVVVWGKLGELCGQYLSKGRQAFLEGKLQTREWTDKDGNKRYTTEIVAQNVQFLGGPGDRAGQSQPNSDFSHQSAGEPPANFTPQNDTGFQKAQSPISDEEVPF